MTAIIGVLLMALGWFIIFLVAEIRMAQHGKDTWLWVQRLYNRSPRLQHIKW